MAWITNSWRTPLAVIPHQTDLNCFRIVKSRQIHNCSVCKKKIPSRSYIYGSDCIRVCLKCGEKFSYEAIKEFENVIKHIKDNQKYLKKNKDKFEAENSLALL